MPFAANLFSLLFFFSYGLYKGFYYYFEITEVSRKTETFFNLEQVS